MSSRLVVQTERLSVLPRSSQTVVRVAPAAGVESLGGLEEVLRPQVGGCCYFSLGMIIICSLKALCPDSSQENILAC